MSKPRKRVLKGANYFVEDDGSIPAILDRIKEIRQQEIIVGVFGDEALVKKAAIHEYGAVKAGIPERSFLRAGLKKYKSTISKAMQSEIASVVEGRMDIKDLMQIIGEAATSKVVEYVEKIRQPPLLVRTIRYKNDQSNKPLIETDELKKSIRYEIRARKKKG